MRRMKTHILFLWLSIVPVAGFAQNTGNDLLGLSLDSLLKVPIKSVGFFETRLVDAPGYSYVYDMDASRLNGVMTLEDIANQFVPGNLVGRHKFEGSLHGVRGVLIDNNSKTLFMLNGQNLNQRCYYGAPFFFQSPLLGDVARVEFLNGPSSLLYGSGAINGFVNLISRNGTDSKGLQATATWGFTQKLARAELGYGFSYGAGKDLYLYAGIADAQGFAPDTTYPFQFSSTLDSALIERVRNYPVHAFEKPVVRLSANWRHNVFSMNALYHQITTPANSFYQSGYWQQRVLAVHPAFRLNLSKKTGIEVVGALSFFDDDWMQISQDYEFAPPGQESHAGGRERHAEIKAIFRTRAVARNQFAAGVVAGERHMDEKLQYFSEALPIGFSIADTRWTEFSAFSENIWSPTEKINIAVGFRYDMLFMSTISGTAHPFAPYRPDDVASLVPRLAASYSFSDNSVLKCSFQKGFRNPEAGMFPRVLFVSQIVQNELGHPDRSIDLKPETMQSIELNLSQAIPFAKLFLNVNAYYNTLENTLNYTFYEAGDQYLGLEQSEVDFISQRLGFGASSMNNLRSPYSVYGSELMLRFRPVVSFTIDVSYSVMQYSDLPDKTFERFPNHLIKGNISAVVKKDVSLNANFHFTPAYKDNIADIPGAAFVFYDESRFLLNMVAVYRFNSSLALSFAVHNITGEKSPPVTFQMNPALGGLGFNERFAYLTLTVNLF